MPVQRRQRIQRVGSASGVLSVVVVLVMMVAPTGILSGAEAPARIAATALSVRGVSVISSAASLQRTAETLIPSARGSTSQDSTECRFVDVGPAHCGSDSKDTPSPDASTFEGWGNLTPYLGLSPPPRRGASMDYDPSDGYVVLFGGEGPRGPLGDTWAFQGASWVNLTPSVLNASNSPSARYGAAMAYDSTDGYLVLFGGASGPFGDSNDPLLNDTWEFSHGNWTRACATCSPDVNEPGPRFESAASNDPSDGGMVLFGGLTLEAGSYTSLNDTWMFAGGSWNQVSPMISPSARYGAGLSLNSTTGPVVLFGGCARPQSTGGPTCAATLGDSWTFSAGVWSELDAGGTSPEARTSFGFASSANTGLELAFGGLSAQDLLNDTWELGQGTWSDLTNTLLSSPSPRDDEGLTYDTASGTNYFVLYGGWNGTYLNETWVYPSPFSPLRVSAPAANLTTTDVGRPFRLNVTIAGGAGGYNRTWLGLPPGCLSKNASSLVCHPETPVSLSASYWISVRVEDARGSIVWSTATRVVVNAQPTAAIEALPSNEAAVPGKITFNATVYGGTAPFMFTWSFGDGTVNGSGNPVVHEYTSVGRFLVGVAVTDALRESAPIANLRVVLEPALVVELSLSSNSTAVGSAITFQVRTSGGFPPYSYTWSGQPSSCPGVNASLLTCSPNATGSFRVTVRVTDTDADNGTSAATLLVQSQSTGKSTSQGPFGEPFVFVRVGIAIVGIAAAVAVVWIRRRSRQRETGPSMDPPPSAGVRPPKP